jgi:hypothetical protein
MKARTSPSSPRSSWIVIDGNDANDPRADMRAAGLLLRKKMLRWTLFRRSPFPDLIGGIAGRN